MLSSAVLFRSLADDARLRLLRVLMKERLNVSELTAILGIAQSGVSRHLGILRDAGLVREEREGGFTYYGAAIGAEAAATASGLWPALREQLSADAANGNGVAVLRDDDARLREVMRQRREQRDAHGSDLSTDRQLVPGRSWAAWSRALGLLLPEWTVADLGCGDGHLTLEIATWAGRVIAVDHSPAVLKRAKALARRRHVGNVEWKRGEIERVPLTDGSVDMAVLSQALHHAEKPEQALAEAARVTRAGGQVLVLELDTHDQAWVTERLGDRWLGFERARLGDMMRSTGLTNVTVQTGLDDRPFGVVVARGTKPSRVPRHRARAA